MAAGEASSAVRADLTRPGVVEASAGTGKTYTIAEIYLALLRGEKTFSPNGPSESVPADAEFSAPRVREILVVTFTEAATAELRARLQKKIRDALAANPADPRVRDSLRLAYAEIDEAAVFTIHGFFLRVLKEFGVVAPTAEILRSVSDELSRFAARWRARRIAAGENIFFSVPAEEIRSVLKARLNAPEALPEPAAADDARGNALFRVAAEAFAEWTALRKNSDTVSYGEMLTGLKSALEKAPALAAKIAARFKFVFVDEFQDTDPVQWEIFRKIFLDTGTPIFCVGDPKQAIYEFRGGDVRTYRRAVATIREKSGGNGFALAANYRSTPEMIAAFNEIFSADAALGEPSRTDPARDGVLMLNAGTKAAPCEIEADVRNLLDFRPAEAPRKPAGTEEKSDDAAASEDAANTADSGVPAAVLKITEPATSKDKAAADVAELVAADIAELVHARRVPAREIAVLVSDNKEANLFRAAISGRRVPVSTTARGNVLREPVARDLGDVLRAMLDPRDSALVRRALLSPLFRGNAEKILLAADAGKLAETELRRAFADARERWEREGFLPAFRALAEKLGVFRNIAESAEAETLTTRIRHIAELLAARESRGVRSPRRLVETYEKMLAKAEAPGNDGDDDEEEFRLRSDSDADAVRVRTVHKSKGLQFDIVFVPTLWKRLLFSSKSKKNFVKREGPNGATSLLFDARARKSPEFLRALVEAEAMNSACLFYVALTRARSRIVLFHVPNGAAGGGKWHSYQKMLLEKAGFLSREMNREKLKRWAILRESEPLPPEIFPARERGADAPENAAGTPPRPLSPEEAEERFALGARALEKIRRRPDGVFSFSSISARAENEAGFDGRENDEAAEDGRENFSDEDAAAPAGTPRENAEDAFPRRSFFDLPGGTEFGNVVHSVFEKVDFRSRENLPALLDANLPRLPGWTKATDAEKNALREKMSALVEASLALPLDGNGFRLESLDASDLVREMDFSFPLRPTRGLYAGLFRIFKSWGGVYAETAERHWAGDGNAEERAPFFGGMMTGVVDLAFRAGGKFFILDWKTNAILRGVPAEGETALSPAALRREIVEHAYALQWAIYAVALRKFLRRTLRERYDHDRDFGGVVYLFVRWLAPFRDAGTLSSARLDELEKLLCGNA